MVSLHLKLAFSNGQDESLFSNFSNFKLANPNFRILKNGDKYPGKHNMATMRANGQNLKPIQPKAQYILIWKALIEYLEENVRAGKSVNIKGFGCFTFNVKTELPKIATGSGYSGDPSIDIYTQRAKRKNIHHVKPVFVVDPGLQYHLIRYAGKEEISPAISQHSIYQKGYRTIYANPVPIAAGACLGTDVVKDALSTLWLAIRDLIKLDKDINLAFGFCNVRFTRRCLNTVFLKELSSEVGHPTFEEKMIRQRSPVSTLWTTTYGEKWGQTTLGTLIKKPNKTVIKAMDGKTEALRVMSLDMSSSGRFFMN